MNANSSGKTRITAAALRFTAGRPSWSPNGRYLAFVKTRAGRSFGYLTRYDTVTHRFVTFTGSISGPHVTPIQALPGTAVAWQWARNAGDGFGSFLLLEGAAAQLGRGQLGAALTLTDKFSQVERENRLS
jgi:hypothetical protein